jgi:DNA repair protein RadC
MSKRMKPQQLTIYGTEEDFYQPMKPSKNYCQIVRENMEYYSPKSTDLQGLLAVIIGAKASPELCAKLASIGIKDLSTMTKSEFCDFGVGPVSASQLVAAFGIARKVIQDSGNEQRITIYSPQDAADILIPKLRHLQQEHFVCLFLNTKNQVIGESTIFVGTLNSSVVHPREVFKEAIKRSSAGIICAHNHPSSDTSASREDIDVTKRLVEAGKITGIDVLDHLIIGGSRYISLKEKGYI